MHAADTGTGLGAETEAGTGTTRVGAELNELLATADVPGGAAAPVKENEFESFFAEIKAAVTQAWMQQPNIGQPGSVRHVKDEKEKDYSIKVFNCDELPASNKAALEAKWSALISTGQYLDYSIAEMKKAFSEYAKNRRGFEPHITHSKQELAELAIMFFDKTRDLGQAKSDYLKAYCFERLLAELDCANTKYFHKGKKFKTVIEQAKLDLPKLRAGMPAVSLIDQDQAAGRKSSMGSAGSNSALSAAVPTPASAGAAIATTSAPTAPDATAPSAPKGILASLAGIFGSKPKPAAAQVPAQAQATRRPSEAEMVAVHSASLDSIPEAAAPGFVAAVAASPAAQAAVSQPVPDTEMARKRRSWLQMAASAPAANEEPVAGTAVSAGQASERSASPAESGAPAAAAVAEAPVLPTDRQVFVEAAAMAAATALPQQNASQLDVMFAANITAATAANLMNAVHEARDRSRSSRSSSAGEHTAETSEGGVAAPAASGALAFQPATAAQASPRAVAEANMAEVD
jgi:hypothetical protein